MTEPDPDTDAVLNNWAADLRKEEQNIEDAINAAADRIRKQNEENK